MEEKIACYKECALFEYEATGDGCPFKKAKAVKIINIKDIVSLDINYDEEEDKEFLERIYVKSCY
jgi:hypothetical protein